MTSQRYTRALVAAVALVLCLAASSFAQSTDYKRPPLQAPSIPSPKSVPGFTPGDDRTTAGWSQITDYFERLDRASDRVVVQTLGQSTLKRPLIVAIKIGRAGQQGSRDR